MRDEILKELEKREHEQQQLDQRLNNQIGHLIGREKKPLMPVPVTSKGIVTRVDPKKDERKQKARLAEDRAVRQEFNRFRAQLACHEIQPNDIRKLYDVRNVIGEGGFGKVRRAIHRLTECTVAIKSYKRSEFDRNPYGVGNSRLEHRQSARKQARIEYECMRRLKNTNIVDAYQLIETPNGVHIVMQYATGGSLAHILKHHPDRKLTEKKAKGVFCQIARAVAHMHRMDVVHRDLKLSNIFLTHGKVLLGDLGTAVTIEKNQLHRVQYIGTVGYMAPELYHHEAYDARAADMWALGALLYEMVVGHLPFDGTSETKIRKSILVGKLRIPNTISAPLRELLKGLLASDPSKRLNADDVVEFPWVNAECQPAERTIDHDCVAKVCELMVISTDTLKKKLEANEADYLTAAYYLLLHNSVAND